MGLQYSLEQLQVLRASPLVVKPASLPPAEEWMGPAADQSQQQKRMSNSRGKSDGLAAQHDAYNPRSTVDGRQFARTSGPSGDIILGPPKTSFASANLRTSLSDSPNRSAFGSFGADGKSDYFARGSFGGDRGKQGLQEDRSRDTRPSSIRTAKEDSSFWPNRSGRNTGIEDDRSYRVNGLRENEADPAENSRKSLNRGLEQHHRDRTSVNDEYKRGSHHRTARPSWFREDEGMNAPTKDVHTEHQRSRAWRDGERTSRAGMEREWARSAKNDQKPEWMEDSAAEQKNDKHNAQDIEEWKASMKARDSAVAPAEPTSSAHNRTVSGSLQNKAKTDTPLSVDPTLDRFLSFFGNSDTSKDSLEQRTLHDQLKPREGRTNPKSSKFTGFFGPKATETPVETNAPGNELLLKDEMPVDHVSEDKAGFQRILQMLGAPQAATSSDADRSRSVQSQNVPKSNPTTTTSPPPILSPRSRKAHDLEGLLGLQSPNAGPVSINKDSEFLLNLLRPQGRDGTQDSVDARERLVQPQLRATLSDGSSANALGSSRVVDPEAPYPPYPVEHEFLEGRYHEKAPSMTYHAPPHYHSLQFDENDEGSVFPPQFTMGIPSQQSHPPGLHRPPGFDQPLPPPGFPQFLHQPQQSHHQRASGSLAPPPGFGMAQHRGPNPQQVSPALMANINNFNTNERGPFSTRPPGPASSSGPGATTGPPPPPGFGIGGPHPMFPAMPNMAPDNFFGVGRPTADFGDPTSYSNGARGGQFRRQ